MKKELEEMVDNELSDFYSDQKESEKKFKLLLEFEPSIYKYESSLFEFSEKAKDVIKAKEVKLGRRKHKGLF